MNTDILIPMYDSRSLTAAVNMVKITDPFIYDTFFKANSMNSLADKIDVEIHEGNTRPAQFVHPEETEPRPVQKQVRKVQTVSIPRTYESKTFSAQDLAKISVIGNAYSTLEARRKAQNEYLMTELEDLRQRVITLRELMAGKAISTGKNEFDQSNINFEIDYLFVPNKQTFNLTATNQWTHADSNPLAQIRTWKRNIQRACGLTPTYMLLGVEAATAFIDNVKVRAMLDNRNIKAGELDLINKPLVGASYLGTILGVRVYEYNQQYAESSDIIDPKYAVMLAPSKDFRVHFGPIYRIQDRKSVSPIYGEFYLEVDSKSNESFVQWNLEQKSLPAIHHPGNIITAKVV